MRWSNLFIPTLRENPAEAESASHQLLLRAGYIRHLGGGNYGYLLLAQRSLSKIARILREEMDRIGAQEIVLPVLHPVQESLIGLVGGELRSYKQLPQIWYQIQTRLREDPRPKSGLLRARHSVVQDSLSFDMDDRGLAATCDRQRDAFRRTLDRCGLKYLVVEGGRQAQEFVAESSAGEDSVVVARRSGYRANLKHAVSRPSEPPGADPAGDLEPEQFATPGRKTIAEVSEFTGLPETSQIKSLVMVADGKPFLLLLRGDHQLNDAKFAAVVGAAKTRAAEPLEIVRWFGAAPGSLGPLGITSMPVLTDLALQGRRNLIAGANKDDYHVRHVTPGEDFHTAWHDLRQVVPGDTCADSGEPLEIVKAIAIGHVSPLGSQYAEAAKSGVLDERGHEVSPLMATSGMEIERILCAAIEQSHDDAGMILPSTVAPFSVVVTAVNYKSEQKAAADELYAGCQAAGLDALLDDRDERPGVKFKDSDLTGIPFRITVGKKLAQGLVEVLNRKTRESTDVPAADAVEWIRRQGR